MHGTVDLEGGGGGGGEETSGEMSCWSKLFSQIEKTPKKNKLRSHWE